MKQISVTSNSEFRSSKSPTIVQFVFHFTQGSIWSTYMLVHACEIFLCTWMHVNSPDILHHIRVSGWPVADVVTCSRICIGRGEGAPSIPGGSWASTGLGDFLPPRPPPGGREYRERWVATPSHVRYSAEPNPTSFYFMNTRVRLATNFSKIYVANN